MVANERGHNEDTGDAPHATPYLGKERTPGLRNVASMCDRQGEHHYLGCTAFPIIHLSQIAAVSLNWILNQLNCRKATMVITFYQQ